MAKPRQPDPQQLAQTQTGINRDSAIQGQLLNNINEKTPFGGVNYSQTGTSQYTDAFGQPVVIPQFTREVTLAPGQQDLLDQQVEVGRQINSLASGNLSHLRKQGPVNPGSLPAYTPPSTAGLPSVGTEGLPDLYAPDDRDYSADRDLVTGSIIDRNQPYFDRDEDAARTLLANRGLTPGSEAWETELDRLGRKENDFRLGATLAGGQEQSRLAGLDLARGTATNASRRQGFSERLAGRGQLFGENVTVSNASGAARRAALAEQLAMRSQPINEIASLIPGARPSLPQFSPPFQQPINSVPYDQYAYQDYQIDQDRRNARMEGLFGLGSTVATGLFGLSDRRAKTDIRRVGVTDGGLPIYTYRFSGSLRTEMGVMADEVAKTTPQAVMERPDGFLAVNYAEIA